MSNFRPSYRIDLDWMNKISNRLELFKRTSSTSNTFVCRCPICGDSKKDKKKTRFYLYTKHFNFLVFCHNCGYSHSFYTFMKDAFPNDFPQYKKDQLLDRFQRRFERPNDKPTQTHTKIKNDAKKKKPAVSSRLKGCVPMSSLEDNHPALLYMKDRSFGEKQLSRLWYTDNFFEVASDLSCESLSEYFPKDQRIVIPFFDENGNIEMVQGRAIGESSLRYISIKTDPNVDKIFGKYEVDRTRTSYCVEGPLDSLFVDNCIATCDSNLSRSFADVLVFDNQPANKEVCDLMKKAIDNKRSIVIWPTSSYKKEDINDIIKLGFTSDELMELLRARTFSGLKAKLEFGKWRKV